MSLFSFTTQKRGFNLIQLLVVISIMSIFAAIVLINVQKVKMNSRDAKRVNELQQVQLALRLFKDKYGRYPSDADSPTPGTGQCAYNTSLNPNGCLQVLVTKGFLPALPKDPKTGLSTTYSYDNWCNNVPYVDTNYRMWVNGENYVNASTTLWWTPNVIGISTCLDPS